MFFALFFLLLLQCLQCFSTAFKTRRFKNCATGYSFGNRLSNSVGKMVEQRLNDPIVGENISASNKRIVDFAKDVLNLAFNDRPTPYAYFYALETIARVPYFAYTSCLHLYETLGLLRKKELMLLHFSESWNELHHLLIMESLGGNAKFSDRFIAQHLAFFYYWIVIALYLSAPALAYDFNKHIENHAFDTYDKYLKGHMEELKQLPPPAIAVEYYSTGNQFLVESAGRTALQSPSSSACSIPKTLPEIKTLYDVFCAIRNDEKEHAETMDLLSRDTTLQSWCSPEE